MDTSSSKQKTPNAGGKEQSEKKKFVEPLIATIIASALSLCDWAVLIPALFNAEDCRKTKPAHSSATSERAAASFFLSDCSAFNIAIFSTFNISLIRFQAGVSSRSCRFTIQANSRLLLKVLKTRRDL